jgi:DNA-directed RNA polymerase specialized sigma24 family protein
MTGTTEGNLPMEVDDEIPKSPAATAPELPPGAPSDLELMLGIQKEDPEALSQLYDRYSGIIKALILRVIHNDAEADDLLQEIFMEITLGDRRVIIRQVIDSLPPPQQEAVELAFFRGMSQREIAAKTNTPLGTVKTRLELGLKKIYDGLKELKDEL